MIDLEHAVYDTFSHQAGADLSVDPSRLQNLLIAADSALDRAEGAFFETIDGAFVLGFEGERSEGSKGRMAYFDIFTVPADRVEKVSLSRLIQTVEGCRIGGYGAEPEPNQRITLPPRDGSGSQNDSRSQNSSQSQNDARAQNDPRAQDGSQETPGWGSDAGGPGGDRTVAETPSRGHRIDDGFVAECWEQMRRDTMQCRAVLGQVEKFFAAVDGAVQETSFVSDARQETDYFDVVGGQELEWRTNPRRIARIVSNLHERGKLTYDALPTYREELEARRRYDRAKVRGQEELTDSARDVVEEFYGDVTSQLDRYPALAANLMADASEGTIEPQKEGDEGFTSRISGMIGGGEDEKPELVDPTKYPSLDDETVAAIDAELDRERQKIRKRLEDRLLVDLEKELLDEIDRQSQRIAEEAVTRLHRTKRSDLHERADDVDS
jgi:hypothetical protein